jgi:hypothetical protein
MGPGVPRCSDGDTDAGSDEEPKRDPSAAADEDTDRHADAGPESDRGTRERRTRPG